LTMASEILTATIDNASIHRLRTTLKRICERSFIAHDLVGAELLAADASDDEANAAASKKRRFPRYAECGQCGDEYDVTDNRDGDCVWHDGARCPSPPSPPSSRDEWCRGFLSDCEEGRADYSLYCRYTCCKRQSEAEGCSVGTHSQAFRPVWVDTTPKKKRARR
ncbi:hypothetical protein K490DRAFT_38680, partial [Saccharata proteae CBS 121410]